ncbi:hypothetical protein HCN44_007891 [Aphidius gifuensis]|uniref:Uncharacterized protein n=1 Tax=Aphidius gifuensis TaxID=684658 RepID=A0A834XTW1_APHGI|nr:hypothetical protein HCN44_007891 [Aphidius gifuensis]
MGELKMKVKKHDEKLLVIEADVERFDASIQEIKDKDIDYTDKFKDEVLTEVYTNREEKNNLIIHGAYEDINSPVDGARATLCFKDGQNPPRVDETTALPITNKKNLLYTKLNIIESYP